MLKSIFEILTDKAAANNRNKSICFFGLQSWSYLLVLHNAYQSKVENCTLAFPIINIVLLFSLHLDMYFQNFLTRKLFSVGIAKKHIIKICI